MLSSVLKWYSSAKAPWKVFLHRTQSSSCESILAFVRFFSARINFLSYLCSFSFNLRSYILFFHGLILFVILVCLFRLCCSKNILVVKTFALLSSALWDESSNRRVYILSWVRLKLFFLVMSSILWLLSEEWRMHEINMVFYFIQLEFFSLCFCILSGIVFDALFIVLVLSSSSSFPFCYACSTVDVAVQFSMLWTSNWGLLQLGWLLLLLFFACIGQHCAWRMRALKEMHPTRFWCDPDHFFEDGSLVNLGSDFGFAVSFSFAKKSLSLPFFSYFLSLSDSFRFSYSLCISFCSSSWKKECLGDCFQIVLLLFLFFLLLSVWISIRFPNPSSLFSNLFSLMPSLFEPSGVVQQEYFAGGTPVIAFHSVYCCYSLLMITITVQIFSLFAWFIGMISTPLCLQLYSWRIERHCLRVFSYDAWWKRIFIHGSQPQRFRSGTRSCTFCICWYVTLRNSPEECIFICSW